METYRLFFAATLSAEVRQALQAIQERLRYDQTAVKWVAPEQMHLTLCFLGETSSARLPQISAAMDAALAGRQSMRLQLAAIGAFPDLRRPSVIWAGIGGDIGPLEHTQHQLADQLEAIGFEREKRPFRAHLTLGRARRDATDSALVQLGQAVRQLPAPPPIAWLVDRVVLFRSELRQAGPIYTEVAECRL